MPEPVLSLRSALGRVRRSLARRTGRAFVRNWREVSDWMPAQAEDDNFLRVSHALDEAGVNWWVVAGLQPGRRVIGVDRADRKRVLNALATSPQTAQCYVRDARQPDRVVPAPRVADSRLGDQVLQITLPTRCQGLEYGFDRGCELEFWRQVADGYRAPRENQASAWLSSSDVELVELTVAGRTARTPEVFTRQMIDDISFDIDVVYTWVDGDDPAWLESRARVQAREAGEEYHPGAMAAARFESRDELRYSLRSLEMFAPWVRKIYLVTSGQVPSWLRTDNPRLELVPHSAIYDDPAQLPTFSSNSIISRLHHIPGLSEHYLYLNDDMFFGRRVTPGTFFLPSGLAKVFPANKRRPFGPPNVDDEPHINLTRNMRALLEREFGVTVSRAIWHTPYPQLVSVHREMEERFAQEYLLTRSHPFRHHTDIVADQLHHYYAQIVGRAVPGEISYEYIGLEDERFLRNLRRVERHRHADVFCLNDAPSAGARPIPDEVVDRFLNTLFPVRSSFER